MKILFLGVMFLSSVCSALQFDTDAYTNEFVWNELMNKILKEGTPTDSGLSTLVGASQIFEIVPEKEHRAVYLTISGKPNLMGEFVIFDVSANEEHWTLQPDGKTWKIDQRFYYMSSKGLLRYGIHRVLTKSEGIIKTTEMPISKEEVESNWKTFMKLWEL